jgi:ATP-binding cassette subfamily B protein
MKLLLKYLKQYKKLLLIALALAAINQIFSLADPQILRLIIDNYASKVGSLGAHEFLSGVLYLLLAGVLAALISRTAKNFQDYFVNSVTQKVGTSLYSDMISHAFALPYQVFEDERSGELLQKADKARQDSQLLIASLINIVFLAALSMLIVTAYAFYVNWLIGLVYLSIVPIMGFTTLAISKKVRAASKRIALESSSLSGSITETLHNVELVKSLGLEQQESERLANVNNDILKLELKKITMIRTLSFIQGTMVNVSRSALLFLMLWLIFSGQITLGEFFTLMFYSFAIFSPLYEFGNVISQYQETRASLEVAQDVFNQQPEAKPVNPKKISNLEKITFQKVSFRYAAATDSALEDISFTASKGKTIAFVGLSGAGKSTIIKLIVGLYRPTAGQIMINDTDSRDLDLESWRKKIGYVSQDTQLFAGTIAENLRFIKPDANDEDCLRVLREASIINIVDRDKAGLQARIGEGGLKLSGGEKQRLAIARALLRRPQLIIFDEATSSLDSLTEKMITKTIADISLGNQEMITILIAHRLSTVAQADIINVLEKGQIIESGSHTELLKNGSLYAAMWREQQGQN